MERSHSDRYLCYEFAMKLSNTLDDFDGKPHVLDGEPMTVGALLVHTLSNGSGVSKTDAIKMNGIAFKLWQAKEAGDDFDLTDDDKLTAGERKMCQQSLEWMLKRERLPVAVLVAALKALGLEE